MGERNSIGGSVKPTARWKWFSVVLLWLATAWLLYPLLVLNTVAMENAKEYLYRSAAGVTIMIIILGKTIFDLLFPQFVSRKVSVTNTLFLVFYALTVTGGIIFMVARMLVLAMQSRSGSGFLF